MAPPLLEKRHERQERRRHYSYCCSNRVFLRLLLPSMIVYVILSSNYFTSLQHYNNNNIDFNADDNDDDTITGIPHINIHSNSNNNKNSISNSNNNNEVITAAVEEEEEEEEASLPAIPTSSSLSSSLSSSSSSQLSSSLLWTDEDPHRTHWWEPYVNTTSRTWDNIIINTTTQDDDDNTNNYYDWCHPINKSNDDPNILYPSTTKLGGRQNNVILNGIIYIKSYKTGSSTAEGINVQIAHNVADRKYNNKNSNHYSNANNNNNNMTSIDDDHNTSPEPEPVVCSHWNRHAFAEKKIHDSRQRRHTDSLLWTLVRHPRKRDLSHVFFFRVSRNHVSPNATKILVKGLAGKRNTQTNYLVGSLVHFGQEIRKSKSNGTSYYRVSEQIKRLIIDQYDFIGVTERLSESLAVMTLLWNLHPTDVIVLSAKKSPSNKKTDGSKAAGGVDVYDDGGGHHKCSKIKSPPIHPTLRKYLNSEELYINSQTDYLLYYAVNESLDRTIQLLGPSIVQERMVLINKLQRLADRHCEHDERTVFPCSSDGIYQGELSSKSCYVQDAGCGHECVNDIMDLYNRGEIQLP